MKREDIQERQEEALQAYERVGSVTEAYQVLQAALLAEIALQLRSQNHWLEQIAQRLKNLDDNSIVTQRREE